MTASAFYSGVAHAQLVRQESVSRGKGDAFLYPIVDPSPVCEANAD